MNEGLITVRYVKALFQLAEDSRVQNAVKEDIENILACINDSTEFVDFLNNPLLKTSKKTEIINALFKNKIQDLTLRFLHLLIENRRELYLFNICHYFNSYYKKNIGIKEASIITANQLSSSHKKEILDFITKKFKVKIELTEIVKPSIIGGFVLRIEDHQINASLESQLNKIKRELINF